MVFCEIFKTERKGFDFFGLSLRGITLFNAKSIKKLSFFEFLWSFKQLKAI
ncbi:hypothetical protein P872_00885 [Rhodonellum psychrophilum GCM71 = DSM 17998]|uniref:Uncharacterized protein n=1 Tax=Rhodonellum psychrophilum GCM71 = DSM 17998 TaxID=1123057 RepID=U5C7A7_9BACT|nr:hypothetical protein P872_00885 [Rhodonellum psychrophilum GCM71 = DSM 17998]